jgi:uncharacterized membrane protein
VPRSFVVNLFWLAFGILVASTAIGLVTLWPEDRTIEQPAGLARPKTLGAEIVAIATTPCSVPGQSSCRSVTVELKDGSAAGRRATFTVTDPPDRLDLDVGDGVRVVENQLPPEAQLGGVELDRYALADFERKTPLLWLGLGFAALVLLTGRWQGLRALIGLGASLVMIVVFVVPAILDGTSAPGVALVGSLAIMLVTLVLTHGIGPKMLAATLGTAAALILKPRGHVVRGSPHQRGGRDRSRGDARRLDRPDRGGAADDGARCVAGSPDCREHLGRPARPHPLRRLIRFATT